MEAALIVGIVCVLVFAFKQVMAKFADGTKAAIAGSLLASMNTASEYGFGGVIASLPGFIVVADALKAIPNPLVNEAITVTALAGITGSASGSMSIALAAMSDSVFLYPRKPKLDVSSNLIALRFPHTAAWMRANQQATVPIGTKPPCPDLRQLYFYIYARHDYGSGL